MNEENALTPYGALAAYRNHLPEAENHLRGEIELAPQAIHFHSVKGFTCGGFQFCGSVYKSTAHFHAASYMIIPGQNNFEVLAIEKGKALMYDEHFFLRYKQRMHIENKTPLEILSHYLKHNPIIVFARRMEMTLM